MVDISRRTTAGSLYPRLNSVAGLHAGLEIRNKQSATNNPRQTIRDKPGGRGADS